MMHISSSESGPKTRFAATHAFVPKPLQLVPPSPHGRALPYG
jgi:hypothetical protein